MTFSLCNRRLRAMLEEVLAQQAVEAAIAAALAAGDVDDADSVWSGDVPPPSPSWSGETFEGDSEPGEPAPSTEPSYALSPTDPDALSGSTVTDPESLPPDTPGQDDFGTDDEAKGTVTD